MYKVNPSLALEIQKEHLLEWKTKLTDECYQDLAEFVKSENSRSIITIKPIPIPIVKPIKLFFILSLAT